MTDEPPAAAARTTARTSRSGPWSAGQGRFLPYALILPGLVFYVAFVIVPIVATLSLSLFRWDGNHRARLRRA